jgi:hypothetical protein
VSALGARTFTSRQLAEHFGVPYRTLHAWVERGLVRPSVYHARGTGQANRFNETDAFVVAVLAKLRLPVEDASVVSSTLYEGSGLLGEPLFIVIAEGTVALAADAIAAGEAFSRTHSSLVLWTEKIINEVRALEDERG